MDVIYSSIQAFILTFIILSAKRNGSDTENNYTMRLFTRLKLLNVFTTEPNDKILKFCMLLEKEYETAILLYPQNVVDIEKHNDDCEQ
jgi:hypothetical protein